jgi:hypothetical protein
LIAIAVFAGIWLAMAPVVVHAADKQAEKFRKDGERAREAIEKARDQLMKTVEAYDVLLGADADKLKKRYEKLNSEIKKMEKVVEEGRKRVDSFQKTAQEFFASWGMMIEGIGTESIKAASEKRLVAARALFKQMSVNLDAAGEEYRPLLASLKEQATLVGQDQSTETLAILGKEAAPDIHDMAELVYASLEKSLSKEVSDEAEMDTILEEEEEETETETETGND